MEATNELDNLFFGMPVSVTCTPSRHLLFAHVHKHATRPNAELSTAAVGRRSLLASTLPDRYVTAARTCSNSLFCRAPSPPRRRDGLHAKRIVHDPIPRPGSALLLPLPESIRQRLQPAAFAAPAGAGVRADIDPDYDRSPSSRD